MHPPLGFSHSQTYSSNTLSRALMLPDTCVRLFGSVTETVHDPTQCYKGDVIILLELVADLSKIYIFADSPLRPAF